MSGVSGDVVKFWLTAVLYPICTIIMSVMCYVHWKKYYSDFYTTERKSVAHRRSKPEITGAYRLVGILTMLNVICSALHCYVLCLTVFLPFAYLDESLQIQKRICKLAIALSATISIPKLLVFYIFTVRLHIVYGASMYGISPKKLKITAVILTLYMMITTAFFLTLGSITVDDEEPWKLEYWAKDGITFCEVLVAPWFFLMWGLFDVGVNVIFCIFFFRPIRDVIKKMKASGGSTTINKTKLSGKMIAVGIKVAILSAVLAFSTMIVSGSWGVLVLDLFALDDLVNSLCLMLMTPYYPDKDYYQKLCYLCILCCDRQGYTLKEHAEDDANDHEGAEKTYDPTVTQTATLTVSKTNTTTGTVDTYSSASGPARSVDTMSAVRIGAQEVSPDSPSGDAKPSKDDELAVAILKKQSEKDAGEEE